MYLQIIYKKRLDEFLKITSIGKRLHTLQIKLGMVNIYFIGLFI